MKVENVMKKVTVSLLACLVCLSFIYFDADTIQPSYADTYGAVKYFTPKSGTDYESTNWNAKTLNAMVAGNSAKTIIIPSGSDFTMHFPIYPGSNTEIIATGAKITFEKGSWAIFVKPKATNYKSFDNLTIIGGTWRRADSTDSGNHGTVFSLAHGNHLTIDGVDVKSAKGGHGIEIIACKNVIVENSNLDVDGTCTSGDGEEALQIDLATKKTAPKLASYGKKYIKGQTCKNVQILNNTIVGAMGICINMYTGNGGKYKSKYHHNVVISGNNVTGLSSTGIAVFNTIGATITNNTVYSYSSKYKNVKSCAIHTDFLGRPSKSFSKSKLTITGNSAYGGYRGIHAFVHTSNGRKYSRITVKNNLAFNKSSKSPAILKSALKKSTKKLKYSGNQISKW